jgi:hypothetical protein
MNIDYYDDHVSCSMFRNNENGDNVARRTSHGHFGEKKQNGERLKTENTGTPIGLNFLESMIDFK